MSKKEPESGASGPKLAGPRHGPNCISLIGMAGAGKTTIGRLLAERLNWAFMDTDYLIESLYGTRLQDVTDSTGRDEFLDLEADMIECLQPRFTVIGTGGSVIYRRRAICKLKKLGPVAHIYAPLEQIMERIALKPDRGIVLGKDQSLADLFWERDALYREHAELKCDSGRFPPSECVDYLIEKLRPEALEPTEKQKA